MIGQRELLKKIDGQIERGKFPNVAILIGEKGSGRKTLAYHISQKMNLDMCVVNPTLDEMMEVYNDLHKETLPLSIYVFDDGDFMPDEATDILKKMIAEGVEATFIIICELLDNIPQGIKEKSVTYMMETYYDDDKFDYLYEIGTNGLDDEDEEFIVETASNLGDIEGLFSLKIKEFKSFVEASLDNMMLNASIPHEICSKIAFDDEDDKFPVRLYWKAFITVCGDRMRTEGNSLMYCRFIAITGDALQQTIGNESSTREIFDSWEVAIREEYENFKG